MIFERLHKTWLGFIGIPFLLFLKKKWTCHSVICNIRLSLLVISVNPVSELQLTSRPYRLQFFNTGYARKTWWSSSSAKSPRLKIFNLVQNLDSLCLWIADLRCINQIRHKIFQVILITHLPHIKRAPSRTTYYRSLLKNGTPPSSSAASSFQIRPAPKRQSFSPALFKSAHKSPPGFPNSRLNNYGNN